MNRLWMRGGIVVVAAMAVALIVVPARAGKPQPPPPAPNIAYEYIDLGNANALAINELGDVVGSGGNRAFIATADSGYATQDLNDFISPDAPWLLRYATDINNLGQIVGHGNRYNEDGSYVSRSWRLSPWNVDGDGFLNVQDIGPSPSSFFSPVINDSGDVAADGFLFTDDGGFQDLNPFFPTSIPDRRVTGINNAVQLSGGMFSGANGDTGWRLTLQINGSGVITGGSIVAVGVIKANRGFAQSTAMDINELGQVAGNSTAGGSAHHAYRYTDGIGLQNLGKLARGGRVVNQVGINIHGDVVGRDDYAGRAFLYMDEFGIFELDARVTNLPANMLGNLSPNEINADGDICGGGFVLRRTAP